MAENAVMSKNRKKMITVNLKQEPYYEMVSSITKNFLLQGFYHLEKNTAVIGLFWTGRNTK